MFVPQRFTYWASVLDFRSYYGIRIQKGFDKIELYQNKRTTSLFDSFDGWKIQNNLYALHTPGHTNDSLSFYLVDRCALFSGDIEFSNNPNSIIEGSIKDTHTSIDKLIKLVKKQKIEILARSHFNPVIGNKNIYTHLINYKYEQQEVYNTVAGTVNKRTKWTWTKLIKEIYSTKNETLKNVLLNNYPATPSFIDNYLFIFLKENNFKFKNGFWLK